MKKRGQKGVYAYIDGVQLKGELLARALSEYKTIDEVKQDIIKGYPQYKVTFKVK